MDTVERLRSLNDGLLMCGNDYSDVLLDAAKDVESLRQQVRELSELLDCVKSEREQQLAEQKRLTALVYRAADPLKKQLAECQAREKVLRDALDDYRGQVNQYGQHTAAITLDMPSDSTALESAIRQAKREGGREALLEAADYADEQSNDAKYLIGDYAKGCSNEAASIAIKLRCMADELKD